MKEAEAKTTNNAVESQETNKIYAAAEKGETGTYPPKNKEETGTYPAGNGKVSLPQRGHECGRNEKFNPVTQKCEPQ